jgi:hypothetical protein
MSRKLLGSVLMFALVAGTPQLLAGQNFTLGYMDFGPTIGIGGSARPASLSAVASRRP